MMTLRTSKYNEMDRKGKENMKGIRRACARDRERNTKTPGEAGHTGTMLIGRGWWYRWLLKGCKKRVVGLFNERERAKHEAQGGFLKSTRASKYQPDLGLVGNGGRLTSTGEQKRGKRKRSTRWWKREKSEHEADEGRSG